MTPRHYDLIVIGSGSGNSIPPEFRDKKVALCEKSTFGGTCINVGCIPTKMFVHTADLAYDTRNLAPFGLTGELTAVDWPAIRDRVFGRIDPISAGGLDYRRTHADNANLDVYDGHATFIGDKTLSTGVCSDGQTYEITGEQIIIAAGARPHVPALIADSGVDFHTNETIMRLEELPDSLLIFGGGFIAVEFAHVFSSLGVDVTIVNRSAPLLRQLDADTAEAFTALMGERVQLALGDPVTAARQDDEGITLTTEGGHSYTADALLVATGRTPNGDLLNLTAGGIEMNGSRIAVDDYGRTSAEGVWALGDVSSPYQLKHVANHEARVVFHNVAHPDDLQCFDHRFVPAAIFSHPQVAHVGMTEDEAQLYAERTGTELTIKVQQYRDVAYGWALGDAPGFCKLIADKHSGQLLGVWIIGYEASIVIQPLIQAMSFNQSAKELARGQYWIHPALPEVVENALLGLEFTD